MKCLWRLYQAGVRSLIACAGSLTIVLIFGGSAIWAQTNQGTITGTVTDPQGAVVPNAQVVLTQTGTGFVLTQKTNRDGMYVFSPVQIGSYSVKVTASGFAAVNQTGLTLNVNQTLTINVTLHPGSVSETVTVQGGAAQLMQTEDASTGQVMSSQVINETPLALRNYVFIAQLAAGVTPAEGSRGQGRGDFDANGQPAEQNDFILDGVDNNSNEVDFLNGASFVVEPPPDALQEFKVQTTDYDAEFGHSAGAVVNAAIKSGTNHIHGDLWEYVRDNDLGVARDYFDYAPTPEPPYHQNQFGGTLGGPFLKNKLFWFADIEALRVISPTTGTYTVPTALMRQGNFSQLLNTSLTGDSEPVTLYEPGSGGATPLTCNGQANVFCASQIDAAAQKLLNLYPQPNAGVAGQTYNNYAVNVSTGDNTVKWDTRLDWNPSQKDQAFFRASYYNERGTYNPPLGFVLDGGGYGSDGQFVNMGENFDLSETHEFSPTLVNVFRFGYNWGHPQWVPLSYDTNVSGQEGLGGIPYSPGNGGLPSTSISGISGIGGPQWYPAVEYQNVFQFLDDVTKVVGKHTFKMGVDFQHLKVATEAPIAPHGAYSFSGFYTGAPGVSFTGFGAADFLADDDTPPGAPAGSTPGSISSAELTAFFNIEDVHWYRSAYAQDTWKISPRLTLNMGVRWDYFEPTQEDHDHQALWYPTSTAPGNGVGSYVMADSQKSDYLAPGFLSDLSQDHISLNYTSNRSLVNPQFDAFSPRIGIEYGLTNRLVLRGGYGTFYGGLMSIGGAPNMGYSYPFQYSVNFYGPSCVLDSNDCESIGQTYGINLTNGFSTQPGWNNGLAKDPSPSTPGLVGAQSAFHTPYTQQWNLSGEYALSNTMALTIGYVGNNGRHLEGYPDQNAPAGLVGPGDNANFVRPFPLFGGSQFDMYEGISSYNALQTTLQRHYANGLSFLADYTWGHGMDDVETPLNGGSNTYRMPLVLPMRAEYASSDWDVRQRFSLNGQYALPFGAGRRYANSHGWKNEVVGGWMTDLVFTAQTGEPTTIQANDSWANGANKVRAIVIADPFMAGGSPNSTNPGTSCAASTRNITHWYNPCSFANPLPSSDITDTQTASNPVGSPLTTPSEVLPYVGPARNQVVGPGFQRINMSLFKNFSTYESQYLQFRVDAFNLFNTPAFSNPGNGINSNGGQITSTSSMGQFTPNSRFLQLAVKYYF